MDERSTAGIVGFLYGLIFSASFGFLVELLQVFINILLFGLPIFAAFYFPKQFPQSYRQANRFSYLGILLGGIINAAIILQEATGFAAIAAILIIPMTIIYIIGYAFVIFLLHRLLVHPDRNSL
ncbi:MAG: hypothetical protein D6732_07435 [Methanobacteriota archaeon]|nr:MAG: hypothetical protein D6732_07435 [Euryarchaeota archaeon]